MASDSCVGDCHPEESSMAVASTRDGEECVHYIVAITFLLLWVMGCFKCLLILRSEFQTYHAKNLQARTPFSLYLKYRFGHWYAWASYASVIILCSLSATLLVIGGCLHSFLATASISDSLWAAWIWIAAPDGGNSALPGGHIVGMIVSLGGMMIFALLVSLITSCFEEALWHLRHGSIPVVEGDHTVIIGWTPQTPVIIEELCLARESSGGSVIVLLTKEAKPEVESMLQNFQDRGELELRNSHVVVRHCGHHLHKDDLHRVAVPSAKRILVLAGMDSSREEADSRTLNILLMLHGLMLHGYRENSPSPKQERKDCCAIVECCLVRNQRVFQNLSGGVQMEVLTVQDFVGQLMVECSRQRGLSSIITETIGFDGDEFYIADVKGFKGWKFEDVLFALPQQMCVGILIPGLDSENEEEGSNEVRLLPGMDVVLTGDEHLVLLAEDQSSIPEQIGENCLENVKKFREAVPKSLRRQISQDSRNQQLVVILGWNECIDSMLAELDHLVGEDSVVIIYSPKPETEREEFLTASQKRRKYTYARIKVQHREGSLGARYKLEELPFEKAEKVFILADSTASSPAEADGMTIAAVLQIRDILISRIAGLSSNQVIVPQVLSRAAEEACFQAGLVDCIDSNRLSARVLASVCESPRLSAVWDQFLSETDGALFRIRRSTEYYRSGEDEIPEEVCFYSVVQMAAAVGEVAIGWSAHEADLDQADPGHDVESLWELNPKDKTKYRRWGPKCFVVVIALSRGRVELATSPTSKWGKIKAAQAAVRLQHGRHSGRKDSTGSAASLGDAPGRTGARRPSLVFPKATALPGPSDTEEANGANSSRRSSLSFPSSSSKTVTVSSLLADLRKDLHTESEKSNGSACVRASDASPSSAKESAPPEKRVSFKEVLAPASGPERQISHESTPRTPEKASARSDSSWNPKEHTVGATASFTSVWRACYSRSADVTGETVSPRKSPRHKGRERERFIDHLSKLAEFRSQGILTESEFHAAKTRLLAMPT